MCDPGEERKKGEEGGPGETKWRRSVGVALEEGERFFPPPSGPSSRLLPRRSSLSLSRPASRLSLLSLPVRSLSSRVVTARSLALFLPG